MWCSTPTGWLVIGFCLLYLVWDGVQFYRRVRRASAMHKGGRLRTWGQ